MTRDRVLGLDVSFRNERRCCSISAGHGIWRARWAMLVKRIDPVMLSMAQGLKALLEPGYILSLGHTLGLDQVRRADPLP